MTETSIDSSNKISLLPSTFGYTIPRVSEQDLFKTAPQKVESLRSTINNVALFSMNISGRCLADLACIRYDQSSKQLSVTTYLAFRKEDGTVTWAPSDGAGAEATLPSMDLRDKGFPNILCPDMNNDGRADFIVPYADGDDKIRFSISQCIRTGFQNARTKYTGLKWTDGSKFLAMDLTGRGSVDIVQIFTDRQKLTFRNFPCVNQNGEVGLGNAIATATKYENIGTIDWFQLNHSGTGAKTLVGIWAKNIGRGQSQIQATVFALARAGDSGAGFQEVKTTLLGGPVEAAQTKYSVLPCDINADGTQDVMLARAEYSSGRMTLTFAIFLGDGEGGFKKHGNTLSKHLAAPLPFKGSDYGQFHITNVNGSNYPTLSYVYQEKASPAFSCLSVDGRSDGSVKGVTLYSLARDLPSNKMEVLSSDINGNGMGDWLLYTLENDAPRVVPVYNNADVTGFLSWARDPMGLRTTIKYGNLSDSAVYKTAVDWRNYSNNNQESYPVIAAPNYVVTQLRHRNDSLINSMDYDVLIMKTYGRARVNYLGRGSQGFEEISSLNVTDGVLTREKYFQSCPLTGLKCQIDTLTQDGPPLKSVKLLYESSFTTIGDWKIYRYQKMFEQTDMVDNDVVVRSITTIYGYDDNGNMTLQSSSETQLGRVMTQSWKRCAMRLLMVSQIY